MPACSLAGACKGKSTLPAFLLLCFSTAYLYPETAGFAGKLYAYFVCGADLSTTLAAGLTG